MLRLNCCEGFFYVDEKKEEYEKKLKELVASRPFELDIDWAAFGRTLASQIPAAAASTAAAATAPAPSNNGVNKTKLILAQQMMMEQYVWGLYEPLSD